MSSEYPDAVWAPSPNYSKRKASVSLIVIHITDGQPNIDRSVARFQKPQTKASAHFVIGQLGEIRQLVLLGDCAWHDSGRNSISVGIEHVARSPGELNDNDEGLPLTHLQLRASARLVAWLLKRFSLPISAVVPHCSSPTTTHTDCGKDIADGGIWPWAEYRQLIGKAGTE